MIVLPVLLLAGVGESECGSQPSNEARFESVIKDVFCNEDVHVTARVTSLKEETFALLSQYNYSTGSFTVLARVRLHPGDSIVLAETIPWSQLAGYRRGTFVLFADVGEFNPDLTNPGSILSLNSYTEALSTPVAFLFARATRTFKVCE